MLTLEEQIDKLEEAETILSRLAGSVNGAVLPEILRALEPIRIAIAKLEDGIAQCRGTP